MFDEADMNTDGAAINQELVKIVSAPKANEVIQKAVVVAVLMVRSVRGEASVAIFSLACDGESDERSRPFL